MTEPPRDWDRELAEVDRAISKQQPAGAVPPAPGAPALPPVRRRSVALTWFWSGLALVLAIALLLWPYDKSCGLQLSFYLGAAGTTAVFAVLGAVSAWTHRRALAHVLSLIVLGWAGVAAAHEILPRTGYAKESRTWLCPAPPATPPVQAPSPAPAR